MNGTRRYRWSIRIACALLLLAGSAAARPASAQELDLSPGLGSSDFPEMGRPRSLAGHVTLRTPVPILWLTAGVRHRRDTASRLGTTCGYYWPVFENCINEPIRHDTRLWQWEAGLLAGGAIGRALTIRGGVARTLNVLAGSSFGTETGRGAGNVYPDGRVWSTALVGEVGWRPWLGHRLGVLARVRHEDLDFHGCATDVGTPFCGRQALRTVELGLVLAR